MAILESLMLGIVQGITEWLPISSKSHLILVQHLFNISPPVIFDLVLHLGSFVVVLFVFWKDIMELISGMLKRQKESWRLFWYLVIATIPVAVIGYLLEKTIKASFTDLRVLGFGFLFSALIIFLSRYPAVKKKGLNSWNTFVIGVSQVLALFPGVSRSGTTISTGMMFGIRKETVARFSFLLFIPTVLGATVLELKDIGQVTDVTGMIIGAIAAMVVGFFSLKILLNIIERQKFHYFSAYCLIIGIITLIIAYA